MHVALLVVFGFLMAALVVWALSMLIHGYFMVRNRVPYVVLPDGAMDEVVEALEVKDADVVYDLGCGDGRVILALQKANLHAAYMGVENDLMVWLKARWRLQGRAALVRGEISRTPLNTATKVFCYLGPQMMAELEPRFARELPKGARVVSVQFPLPHRQPAAIVELPRSAKHAARLYVYNY